MNPWFLAQRVEASQLICAMHWVQRPFGGLSPTNCTGCYCCCSRMSLRLVQNLSSGQWAFPIEMALQDITMYLSKNHALFWLQYKVYGGQTFPRANHSYKVIPLSYTFLKMFLVQICGDAPQRNTVLDFVFYKGTSENNWSCQTKKLPLYSDNKLPLRTLSLPSCSASALLNRQ